MCDVEKFLNRYFEYESQIKYVEMELKQEKFKYENQRDCFLRSSITCNTKVSKTNAISRPVEVAVDGLIEHYAKRVKQKADKLNLLLNRQEQIIYIIDDAFLSADERKYIELRYFKGYKVCDVAKSLGYSVRNCNRIKQMAIGKILFSKGYLEL